MLILHMPLLCSKRSVLEMGMRAEEEAQEFHASAALYKWVRSSRNELHAETPVQRTDGTHISYESPTNPEPFGAVGYLRISTIFALSCSIKMDAINATNPEHP